MKKLYSDLFQIEKLLLYLFPGALIFHRTCLPKKCGKLTSLLDKSVGTLSKSWNLVRLCYQNETLIHISLILGHLTTHMGMLFVLQKMNENNTLGYHISNQIFNPIQYTFINTSVLNSSPDEGRRPGEGRRI